jgi:Tudor domain
MSDYMENKKHQMRPIARNLRAPQPPKFSTHELKVDAQDFPATTFKSNVTIFQTPKKVRITHYEKGCRLFYVQLESQDRQLQMMMDNIQGTRLVRLNTRPSLLGMACLAKYNRKVYRVAVAKINSYESQDHSCHFVDLGFTRTIRFENLFYIPNQFLREFTFAFPFTLKECKFKADPSEIDYYFQTITENKLLSLKCQFAPTVGELLKNIIFFLPLILFL